MKQINTDTSGSESTENDEIDEYDDSDDSLADESPQIQIIDAMLNSNEEKVLRLCKRYRSEIDLYWTVSQYDNICRDYDDIKAGMTLLHVAALFASEEVITWLIQHFVYNENDIVDESSADISDIEQDEDGAIAVLMPNYAVPEKENPLTYTFPKRGTPLHYACAVGNKDAFRTLLYSSDINAEDDYGRTPLIYAVMRDDFDHVVSLLDRINVNIVPDILKRDRFNKDYLYYALRSPNIKQTDRNIYLFHLFEYAKEYFQPIVLDTLLNRCYAENKTLCHLAVETDDLESLEIICSFYPDNLRIINQVDANGRTPYQYALHLNRDACADMIKSHPQWRLNTHVEGTGLKKRVDELVSFLNDANSYLAIPTLFDDELECVNTSDESSDEGETPAHTAIRHEEHARLHDYMRHPEFQSGIRSRQGETIMHGVKRKSTHDATFRDSYHAMRTLQTAQLDDSSTGSSSSEDIASKNTLMRIELCDGTESSDEDDNDLSWQQALTQLNAQLADPQQKPDPELAKQFGIVHFRGINRNRDYFSRENLPQWTTADLTQKPVHCRLSYYNARVDLDNIEANPDDESEMIDHDELVIKLWNKVLLKPYRIQAWWKSERTFSCLADAIQHRYTTQASKTNEQGLPMDIWEDIWAAVTPHIDKILLDQPMLESLLENLELKGNIFISTGKYPEHAVRYALGASLSSLHRSTRADPRYRPDGKPKRCHIGLVYTFLHRLDEYLSVPKSDVLALHKADRVSIRDRYMNETEVSFVGGIDQQHVAAVNWLGFPDFSRDYSIAYHQEGFRLTRGEYDSFKKGFSETQRPTRLSCSLLKSAYRIEFGTYFNITEVKFKTMQQWLGHLEDRQKPITREILKNHKALMSDTVFKKIDAQLRQGRSPSREMLKNALTEYLSEQQYAIFQGEYDSRYAKAFGVTETAFNDFKKAFTHAAEKKPLTDAFIQTCAGAFSPKSYSSYRKKLAVGKTIKTHHWLDSIKHHFRQAHPYRQLKNALREHLATSYHETKHRSCPGVFSEKLLTQAHQLADARGLTLVVMDANGQLQPMPKQLGQNKGKLVHAAKRNQPSATSISSSQRHTLLPSPTTANVVQPEGSAVPMPTVGFKGV